MLLYYVQWELRGVIPAAPLFSFPGHRTSEFYPTLGGCMLIYTHAQQSCACGVYHVSRVPNILPSRRTCNGLQDPGPERTEAVGYDRDVA